jgi:hypothetical protein
MARNRFWVLIVVTLAATLIAGNAVACSCAPLTLEARYRMSPHVFTAVTLAKYTEPGDRSASERTTFRVTDIFKGNPVFTALASNPFDQCGIHLETGRKYLIFAPDSGHVSLCSGVQSADDAEAKIAALEAFATGRHADLAEPWEFMAADQGCSLSTQFAVGRDFGLGSLTFGSSREAPRPPFDGPHFMSPALTVHLPDHVLAPGRSAHPPLTLTVENASYKAEQIGELTIEVTNERGETFPLPLPAVYILNGPGVEALLRQLVSSDALTIRYDMEGSGPNLDIDVRTTNLGNSGAEMLECLTSHRRRLQ